MIGGINAAGVIELHFANAAGTWSMCALLVGVQLGFVGTDAVGMIPGNPTSVFELGSMNVPGTGLGWGEAGAGTVGTAVVALALLGSVAMSLVLRLMGAGVAVISPGSG